MAFKIIGGLDETCQVLYNGLQAAHKIGAEIPVCTEVLSGS